MRWIHLGSRGNALCGVLGAAPLAGSGGNAPGGGPASRLAGGVGGNAPEAKRFTLIR